MLPRAIVALLLATAVLGSPFPQPQDRPAGLGHSGVGSGRDFDAPVGKLDRSKLSKSVKEKSGTGQGKSGKAKTASERAAAPVIKAPIVKPSPAVKSAAQTPAAKPKAAETPAPKPKAAETPASKPPPTPANIPAAGTPASSPAPSNKGADTLATILGLLGTMAQAKAAQPPSKKPGLFDGAAGQLLAKLLGGSPDLPALLE
jgi:outer membrane biosynthesis protein TonB